MAFEYKSKHIYNTMNAMPDYSVCKKKGLLITKLRKAMVTSRLRFPEYH